MKFYFYISKEGVVFTQAWAFTQHSTVILKILIINPSSNNLLTTAESNVDVDRRQKPQDPQSETKVTKCCEILLTYSYITLLLFVILNI